MPGKAGRESALERVNHRAVVAPAVHIKVEVEEVREVGARLHPRRLLRVAVPVSADSLQNIELKDVAVTECQELFVLFLRASVPLDRSGGQRGVRHSACAIDVGLLACSASPTKACIHNAPELIKLHKQIACDPSVRKKGASAHLVCRVQQTTSHLCHFALLRQLDRLVWRRDTRESWSQLPVHDWRCQLDTARVQELQPTLLSRRRHREAVHRCSDLLLLGFCPGTSRDLCYCGLRWL